ncbi:MAG: zf-HC2 domain-containing protein [Elusimicrobia bacterium]|nr:zf-HC2 domain-containing protein [Elusimicrobiota bacterium]
MTENRCPPGALLSAYVDREVDPSEERRVGLHLAGCGGCRARVRSLGRLKLAMRHRPTPSMPADLREDLLRMARDADARRRARRSPWARLSEAALELAAGLRARPAWAAAGAALLLTVALAGRRIQARPEALTQGPEALTQGPEALTQGPEAVSVDFVLAAHNEYSRTLPLASTEKIMTELPVQISSAGSEEGSDVY